MIVSFILTPDRVTSSKRLQKKVVSQCELSPRNGAQKQLIVFNERWLVTIGFGHDINFHGLCSRVRDSTVRQIYLE